jgi:hypothetical protein
MGWEIDKQQQPLSIEDPRQHRKPELDTETYQGPMEGDRVFGDIPVAADEPAPGVQGGDEDDEHWQDQSYDWMRVAKESWRSSTSFFDTNYRKRIEDSIRAFNSQHAQDSKYNTQAYAKRSNLYRPKLRSIERKNEAAAASAFFSNVDVVDIQAQNQANPIELASAAINKELIQYRLEKSIKWFRVLLGGLQDAQKSGAVVARVFWQFEQDHKGNVRKDKPAVELIPLENFRWDPAANWLDPIAESPYLIHLLPMYVCDVKDKMRTPDAKTGSPEWRQYGDNVIKMAQDSMPDTTRAIRERMSEDAYSAQRAVQDYSVVWIQRHIHRRRGVDWEFYTLADQALLTTPQPLEISTWHGERDYVLGNCILETHTSMPPSLAELGKQLFDEINEVTNQRADNVKFVLNKKWIVRRNRNVDTAGLTRNVPGGVVTADDPEGDIRELTWPDVTASSYQEQDRLSSEADELLGNFNAVNLPRTGQLADTVHGAQMLTAPSSMMTEYLLRTFVETFVLPVLKLLVKLEQHYETDDVILALAGQKAKIYERYGINHISDNLLNKELTVRVSVGMGATDPAGKLQKFVIGISAFINLLKNSPPGLFNVQEIAKEIFGHLGYQDGARFMTNDNPAVADLQNKLQQALVFIQNLGKQLQDRTQDNQTKVEVAKIAAGSRETAAAIAHASGIDPMHTHVLKAHEIALKHEADVMKLEAELKKFIIEQITKVNMAGAQYQLDARKQAFAEKHPPQGGKKNG